MKNLKKLRDRIKGKLIVGVTGLPGCGKSEVLNFFSEMGAFAVSADLIAANLLTKKECYSRILREFNSSITENGFFSKKKLAETVFKNKSKRLWLENFLHPLIVKQVASEIKKSTKKIAIVEAPLLFESGFDSFTDLNICVMSKKADILKRLKKRNWSKKEAYLRIGAQFTQEKKCSLSDIVINNESNLKKLENEVQNAFLAMKKMVI